MKLNERVRDNKASICVVGVGFVGLPLSIYFAREGFKVVGLDVDSKKIKELKNGKDPTQEIGDEILKETIRVRDLDFTDNPKIIKNADFVIISVPTPIDDSNRPVLDCIEKASEMVGKNIKKGSILVLESSVYPGVTEEIVKPSIEKYSGLKCGVGFGLGYSPERMNPGDVEHSLTKVVKVIGGCDDRTTNLLAELYGKIIKAGVYKTENIKTAEAAKIIENIQRDLNIALVNELAIIFRKMGIDVVEVLKAAETKWNFHSYRPGFVGGHCIPVDPYYLVYKCKSLNYDPKIILSGREINEHMPIYVADIVLDSLKRKGINPQKSSVLLLGLTFKKNVGDIRSTPSKILIDRLKSHKIKIIGYEPLIQDTVLVKEFGIDIINNIKLNEKVDCIVLVTDHNKFKNITADDIKKMSKGNPTLVDVRRFFDKKEMERSGIEYIGL